MTPKIYILLPVHNRKEVTRVFMQSLQAQSFTDYQLLLIDDGCTDGTADMVRQYIANVIVLQGSGHWWWAGSLQKGIDWLKSRNVSSDTLVLIINDDVRFAPDYLQNAVHLMSKKPGTLMLSRFVSADGREILETGVDADFRNFSFDIARSPELINCLSTRGLFMHWQEIVKTGNFHPRLLPHYASDWEYTIRAHRKGLKCETSDQLQIVPNFETSGTHVIKARGFMNFARKYFDRKTLNNPVHWSIFMMLASDRRWLPLNLVRIWVRTAKALYRAFVTPAKPDAD